jgi:hypothetical protein
MFCFNEINTTLLDFMVMAVCINNVRIMSGGPQATKMRDSSTLQRTCRVEAVRVKDTRQILMVKKEWLNFKVQCIAALKHW